jgi:eukaryotic-like serine/threonine-protein kinase
MMRLVAGSSLGRYRLVERVATGGMGEVYRGFDVGWGGMERLVAVKLIAPTYAREPEFVRTFVDEARLSFLLCHSNIVQVRDIGQTDQTYFIAMEWVEGGDLGAILRRLRDRAGQPLPMRFAVLVAVDVARGLDYAHRMRDPASGKALRVVHRDISPSNLLVSFEGDVKITDFGIARSMLRSTPSLPGSLKGKIGYLSPEQARGEDVDGRTDVFALGAVLYEMLTGQNPFTHDVSEREALARVQAGAFRPPRLAVPALPQGLEAIVLRAMATKRDDRYATCGVMREDLETFARREGYALSPSDLGAFVRDLLSASETGPTAQAESVKSNLSNSRPRITAPKPFDVALGESLAQLGAPEADDGPSEVNADGPTAPGKRPREGEGPRTVALHPVISKPISAPRPVEKAPPAESVETEQIPRSYSPRTILYIGVPLLLAAVVVAAMSLTRREPEALGTVLPAPAASPPPVAAVVGTPNPTPFKIHSTMEPHYAMHASRPKPKPAETAKLSVDSDVPANVYVDGEFVQVTPLVALELSAGRHVIRAESSSSGLRLIPREETLVLKAGETQHLNMDLK